VTNGMGQNTRRWSCLQGAGGHLCAPSQPIGGPAFRVLQAVVPRNEIQVGAWRESSDGAAVPAGDSDIIITSSLRVTKLCFIHTGI
jgi:hypothetical protein